MKIKVARGTLLDGLKRVHPAANAKSVMEVYANVKIEAGDGTLVLTTTNGTLTIMAEVDCEVEEQGSTTMPMQLLCRMIENLQDGVVCMTETGDKMVVKCGASKYNVTGIAADRFPVLPNQCSVCEVTLPAVELKKLVRRTSYAQSSDETRKTLQGVLFEVNGARIRCVATDGKRLAIAERGDGNPQETPSRFIIPTNSVQALQNFLTSDSDVSLVGSADMMKVEMDGGKYKLFTKLVAGEYPNYSAVIPSTHAVETQIDREMVVESIQRVSVMALDVSAAVKTTFENNLLVLEVNGANGCNARDEIPVKYDGEKIEAFFSPKYVMDPLKSIDSDVITLELTNGHTAAKFVSKDERFMYVLMPLRLAQV